MNDDRRSRLRPAILPTSPWLVRFLRACGASFDAWVILAGVWTLLQTPASLDDGFGFYEGSAVLWSLLLIVGGGVSFLGTVIDRPRPQLYGSFSAALGAAIWAVAATCKADATPISYAISCVLAAVVTVLVGRGVAVPAVARIIEAEGALRRDDR